MNHPPPTTDASDGVQKKAFPWIALGVPIGCAIGIAIGNLALGIGMGIVAAATLAVFGAKKNGRKISPVVQLALVIACTASVVLAYAERK